MPRHKKDHKHRERSHRSKRSKEQKAINTGENGVAFIINITYNIGDIHIEQRAEGGGQINRNVGTNANQGGQNALNHSSTANTNSHFADGNGRSGIAGNNNDEAGGQQGIKVRDSDVIDSIIESSSTSSQ